MPHSYGHFDDFIRQFLIKHPPTVGVLDIGAGAGKYGRMLRAAFPKMTIDAVEVWVPYVEQFKLFDVYNSVLIQNVANILPCVFGKYDLIVLGDILEHLTVHTALDVLGRIPASTAILVAVPYLYSQGPVDGNVHEAHLQSDLTDAIFRERYYQFGFKKIFGNNLQGIYYRGVK